MRFLCCQTGTVRKNFFQLTSERQNLEDMRQCPATRVGLNLVKAV